MSTAKMSTFNMLFIIKKSKLLKNGEAPICLRITVNKETAELMIKRSVPADLWNQLKQCSNGTSRVAKELNHYLETVKANVLKIHRELEIDGQRITNEIIKERFLGKDNKQAKKLIAIYKEHNAKCEELIGIDYKASTIQKFQTYIQHLQRYVSCKYKKDDIQLSELNAEFIRNFEHYLKVDCGLNNNSTIKNLKALKKIIRIALANEWIKKDPITNIKFKLDEVNVDFLSLEELNRITSKEITIQRIAQVRDIFVFCCYTGLAYVDVKQLKQEHLFTDNNGKIWIRINREKTTNMCNIPVLSVAEKILNKYSDNLQCKAKGVLLPVLTNQKMNAYLKEIADICGISKRLTMHVARHTCATTVMLANDVSLANLAKILGHSNTKMTEHYAKVLDSSIMRDMENVEKNLSSVRL